MCASGIQLVSDITDAPDISSPQSHHSTLQKKKKVFGSNFGFLEILSSSEWRQNSMPSSAVHFHFCLFPVGSTDSLRGLTCKCDEYWTFLLMKMSGCCF